MAKDFRAEGLGDRSVTWWKGRVVILQSFAGPNEGHRPSETRVEGSLCGMCSSRLGTADSVSQAGQEHAPFMQARDTKEGI